MSNPFVTSGASYQPPSSSQEMNVPLQPAQPPVGGAMPEPQSKVMLFHVLFKALALLSYLNLWGAGYVLTFVLVTVLSALGELSTPSRAADEPARRMPPAACPSVEPTYADVLCVSLHRLLDGAKGLRAAVGGFAVVEPHR
jgi:hypothetical protein